MLVSADSFKKTNHRKQISNKHQIVNSNLKHVIIDQLTPGIILVWVILNLGVGIYLFFGT